MNEVAILFGIWTIERREKAFEQREANVSIPRPIAEESIGNKATRTLSD